MSDTANAPDVSPYAVGGRASGAGAVVAFVDRWMFVFMAGLFFATVLVGFIPDSFGLVRAVQTGARPPLPPILHVHAVLMGSWITLLLVQATLVATGHRAFHRQLGLASLVLAPAMVLAGLILVPTLYHQLWAAVQTAPPPVAAQLKPNLALAANIMLGQIRVGILFPLFVALALLARRSDPGTHKRLMILATVGPLPAAIARIHWLPSTMPGNPASADLDTLLWILPMFAWDLYRQGRAPRAYWIWAGANAPLLIAEYALWGSPWWLATVPKLMGLP
jgi:hypothetical protein